MKSLVVALFALTLAGCSTLPDVLGSAADTSPVAAGLKRILDGPFAVSVDAVDDVVVRCVDTLDNASDALEEFGKGGLECYCYQLAAQEEKVVDLEIFHNLYCPQKQYEQSALMPQPKSCTGDQIDCCEAAGGEVQWHPSGDNRWQCVLMRGEQEGS